MNLPDTSPVLETTNLIFFAKFSNCIEYEWGRWPIQNHIQFNQLDLFNVSFHVHGR